MGRFAAVVKRSGDIAVAASGLIMLSPVMAVTAFAVAAQLGRPVIFSQARPGRDGRVFLLRKFRTMLPIDESKNLTSDDERLTRFGRLLRSTSLDELPTLWNVLRGDMSLVGPRPLLVDYLPLYTPRQSRRHEVRPGVTGLAQVSGRNLLDWDSKLELDVQYVDRQSLKLDLLIIFRTFSLVFSRRGVSADGAATMPRFTGSPARKQASDG